MQNVVLIVCLNSVDEKWNTHYIKGLKARVNKTEKFGSGRVKKRKWEGRETEELKVKKNGWVENIQRPIGYYDSFKSNMAGY